MRPLPEPALPNIDPAYPSVPLPQTPAGEDPTSSRAWTDDEDRAQLIARGVGITNLVSRATARAGELSRTELRQGAQHLNETVRSTRPLVVAVAGITAYRHAFGERRAGVGRQAQDLAGAELWVVPNPSGLNAHETVDSLADCYRQVAVAAGVVDD